MMPRPDPPPDPDPGSESRPPRPRPLSPRRGGPPGRSFALGSGSSPLPEIPLDDLLADFQTRWERGDAPRVEDYLDRLGPDRADDLVELIYLEYRLSEEAGLGPSADAYFERFAPLSEKLDRLFRMHDALRSSRLRLWEGSFDDAAGPPAPLPEEGDEIGPYRLLRTLGEGGFARVFLAEQADLADRLVVVKVSARVTPEPKLLAKARHPNIVEVLWHGMVDDGSLQVLCLPFLGGASLGALLTDRRQRKAGRPSSGADWLAELDRVGAPEYRAAGASRPIRELLSRLSYPEAVAWVVARLAEALDFAYACNVVHGDVKPSNVLLTAEAVPMLLDFNLAVGWRPEAATGGRDPVGDAGGTLAYMAPERLRAVAEPDGADVPSAAARHKADVYSLGVVLLELLTGRPPLTPNSGGRQPSLQELASAYVTSRLAGGAVMVRAARGPVAPGLRSILERCLAADPADRYRRAADLAADLDRWRKGEPLLVAPEPALRFGLVRWARRRRAALAAAAVGVAAALGAAGLIWHETEALRPRRLASAPALFLGTEDFPFRYDLNDHVRGRGDPAVTARRHLELFGVLGAGDWRSRDDFRRLPAAEREELEVWLLEQALRFAHALGERPDSPDDWQRGLDCLNHVTAADPFAPLLAEAHRLRTRLGLPAPAPTTAPPDRRWMADYLEGVQAEVERDNARAYQCFLEALARRPGSFRVNYRAAAVAFYLRDHAAAARHLRVCVDQWPDNPTLHYQLAGCLYGANRTVEADEEYRRVQLLNPDFAENYLSRAFVRLSLGQPSGLLQDLHRVDTLRGRDTGAESDAPALVLAPGGTYAAADGGKGTAEAPPEPDEVRIRLDLARRLAAGGHTAQARGVLEQLVALVPDDLQVRYARGLLLYPDDPKEAARDFARVVAHPRADWLVRHYPPTLYAFNVLAHVQNEAGRADEAAVTSLSGLRFAGPVRDVIAQKYPEFLAGSYLELAKAAMLRAAQADSDAVAGLRVEASGYLTDARRLAQAFVDRQVAKDPELRALVPAAAPGK